MTLVFYHITASRAADHATYVAEILVIVGVFLEFSGIVWHDNRMLLWVRLNVVTNQPSLASPAWGLPVIDVPECTSLRLFHPPEQPSSPIPPFVARCAAALISSAFTTVVIRQGRVVVVIADQARKSSGLLGT